MDEDGKGIRGIHKLIIPTPVVPVWEKNIFPWRTDSQRMTDYRANDHDHNRMMLSSEEIKNLLCEIHLARYKEIKKAKDGKPTEKYWMLFGACVFVHYVLDITFYHDFQMQGLLNYQFKIQPEVCDSCERPMEKIRNGDRYVWRCPECYKRSFDLTGGPNPIDGFDGSNCRNPLVEEESDPQTEDDD
jgi:hypothetical protein